MRISDWSSDVCSSDLVVEVVRSALQDSGLPPQALTLEMTESVLLEDVDHAVRTLAALKALGVRMALDEFGTGYSSLSSLDRFPVDIVKKIGRASCRERVCTYV